ncbi:Prolipoprotein diacylglyceryl transferase [Aquicella siphonis]|uniref:Phosphatidylglycerol--prolipoprotein diacylglyceryl transferase n=1 Tax=Aquicella siphonis TaxID=254247 RepID=A0A5E4PI48_9COXI|nr:prolipoprotein diacylglyceryl transferase [Aquicella siphonis]VVC76709.1 Prolipoprotein diacylglyceryl transferase [Aquicella siphonis]
MLTYPAIDPVAFHIASWPVYWYGLMYLIGFLAGWALLSLRTRYSPRGFTQDQVSDIAFYTALGAIIGGRLGYMFFYDWKVLFSDPLLIFQTWKGGMSFHGGLLGVLIAMMLFARKAKKPFLALTDFIAPVVPIGLGAGRIGNFINGELWGRITDVSWGMIFPHGGPLPRHPSQLYEFSMEGVLLFLILFVYSWKPRPLGAVSGLFALFYGLFRCIAEFFREPDAQIGYLFGGMTEGQLLSIPLILAGLLLLLWSYKKGKMVT